MQSELFVIEAKANSDTLSVAENKKMWGPNTCRQTAHRFEQCSEISQRDDEKSACLHFESC